MAWYAAIFAFFSALFSGLFGHLFRSGGTQVSEEGGNLEDLKSKSSSSSNADPDSDSSDSDSSDDDSSDDDEDDEEDNSKTTTKAAAATTTTPPRVDVSDRSQRRGRSNAFYGGERPTVNLDGTVSIKTPVPQSFPDETSSFKLSPGDPTDASKGTPSTHFHIGVASTIGRRPTMEDAHLILGQYGDDAATDLIALFDGHNGSDAAAHSTTAFPAALSAALATAGSPAAALRAAFVATHESIAAAEIRSGTTATAVLRRGGRTYVAHVGDSRVALVRRGALTCFTKDHRPTDPEEQAGVIARGGIVFRGRVGGMLAITRALGDKSLGESVSHVPDVAVIPFPEGEVKEENEKENENENENGNEKNEDDENKVVIKKVEDCVPDENDTLIVACDGLWDYVDDESIAKIVSENKDPKACAEALRDESYNRSSRDNITVIVIKLNDGNEEAKQGEEEVKADDEKKEN